ncbi:MAG TPA: hypothetical protein VFL28_14045 [bacterium]|nr:hypothetical protein [bacterium]
MAMVVTRAPAWIESIAIPAPARAPEMTRASLGRLYRSRPNDTF